MTSWIPGFHFQELLSEAGMVAIAPLCGQKLSREAISTLTLVWETFLSLPKSFWSPRGEQRRKHRPAGGGCWDPIWDRSSQAPGDKSITAHMPLTHARSSRVCSWTEHVKFTEMPGLWHQ